MTAYNGTAITYDQIGNRLTDGTWTYTWEHGRELTSMTDGTNTWTYTYDANGLRTKRTNGNYTYEYIYDGNGKLVFMQYHHYKMYFTYDPLTGAPHSVYYDDSYNEQYTMYYITNTRGDVLAMAKEDGTIVVSYDYDAWGNLIHYEDSTNWGTGDINPLRYRGYIYDRETGLYYLQSRYYAPEIGRFINADGLVSTGQGILSNNTFAYCGGNPVMQKDSAGYRPVASTTLSDSYWERRVSCASMKGYDLTLYGEIYRKEEMLKSLGFTATNTRRAADYYQAISLCGITTVEQEAHFLAQCYVEGNLSLLEAGYLDYTSAEAYRCTKPYYPYYGAGYIQLTWDYNYQAFSEYMNDPLIYSIGPQYVASHYPWSAAGWFWSNNGINSVISNGGSVADVTRIVNGGYSALSRREAAYVLFLGILGG